jgi:hypothetical protein
VTLFAIRPGFDHRDTIGKVAPGVFAPEGRCWRFDYENAAGHARHCVEPVAWVGRWRFRTGWERSGAAKGHADELWVRRLRSMPYVSRWLSCDRSLGVWAMWNRFLMGWRKTEPRGR